MNARDFAKRYVELTEALIAEGVPEFTARAEARLTTIQILLEYEGDAGETCPVCGRGGEIST